jgi:hypothetical protein
MKGKDNFSLRLASFFCNGGFFKPFTGTFGFTLMEGEFLI